MNRLEIVGRALETVTVQTTPTNYAPLPVLGAVVVNWAEAHGLATPTDPVHYSDLTDCLAARGEITGAEYMPRSRRFVGVVYGRLIRHEYRGMRGPEDVPRSSLLSDTEHRDLTYQILRDHTADAPASTVPLADVHRLATDRARADGRETPSRRRIATWLERAGFTVATHVGDPSGQLHVWGLQLINDTNPQQH